MRCPWIILPLLVFACAAEAHNGKEGAEPRWVGAQRASGALKIDGVLDEADWQRAQPANDFRQKEPLYGEPASERTEVRILYSQINIYFGVVCYDSEPAKIIATELRRDQDLGKDDSIWIVIDTFHDHRNSFLFVTNALGTRFDARITDEGRDVNANWDERWQAAAKITESGWTAEIEIPFKSLRMPESKNQVWGIDFQRIIRRKNETVFWNNYSRDFTLFHVSQAGHLIGLEGIERGLRLRFKPFVVGGASHTDFGQGSGTERISKIGFETIKFRITSGLTSDFTVNPDFAQVDIDEQVVNVTRFPVFFPEKREFFREDLGIFEFGTGVGIAQARDLKAFFSRRIGISDDGTPIPILAGIKLTGRTRGFSLGFIEMQTDNDEATGTPGNNFGVFRIKRDVFSRSNIGAIFTNRQSDRAGDYNRLFGFDGNFVFFKNLHLQSFISKSETPGLEADDWAGRARMLWDSDFLLAEIDHLNIGSNYNAEVGWVPRPDQQKTSLAFGIKPRPDSRIVRQLVFRTRMDYIANRQNIVESKTFHLFTLEAFFQSGDHIEIDFHREFERLFRPFRLRNLLIPPGDYRVRELRVEYTASPARKIAGSPILRFVRENGFWGGHHTELRLNPDIKLSENLLIGIGYALDDVDVPQGSFTAHVINSRFNYSFSDRWLTSTTVQYNNLANLVNFRFRLNYIFRQNDNFFFVFNETRDTRGGIINRAVIFKLTYSFDF